MKTYVSIQVHRMDELYPDRPYVATVVIPNYKRQSLRGMGARGKTKFGAVVKMAWHACKSGVLNLREGQGIPLMGEKRAGK